MASSTSPDRILRGYRQARETLLGERNAEGYWVGELSTSSLSTATAIVALQLVGRHRPEIADRLELLIRGGVRYLAEHQNPDGGWGDTCKSLSNISTTMLADAALHATGNIERYAGLLERSQSYIDRGGGIVALRARYGKDRTFSIPILTHCALCDRLDWREVSPLPFELACLPHAFYKYLQLPVVSYALPALIALGQARHYHRKPLDPITRVIRALARRKSLQILENIQPTSGGFLEAAPLTSFVTMSLASIGLARHPVARLGVDFLAGSVRDDGGWPIDSNLATWVSTLSVNALGEDLPEAARQPILEWLLNQQYQQVHPYTNADPGGWAWTDLPGGVPDADDTAGVLLALRRLSPKLNDRVRQAEDDCVRQAVMNGIGWLLGLQNSGGGWPTFCKGWGYLPFDRSSADITAHVLRALWAWREDYCDLRSLDRAIQRGKKYLQNVQRDDGSWLPLWFGNQHCPDEENPTYGTARVLAAFRDLGWLETPAAQRGFEWLLANQNPDGGWGGGHGTASSVEETALASDILLSGQSPIRIPHSAIDWLLGHVESGTFTEPSPIGFYFAKLWYYEKLYPIIFTTAALRRALSLDCQGFP